MKNIIMENLNNDSKKIMPIELGDLTNPVETDTDKVESDTWVQSAKEALVKAGDNVWDYSDPILLWNPKGVAEYQTIQREASYKDNVERGERKFLHQIAGDVAKQLSDNFVCVDLGPGTGEESALFLSEIQANGKQVKEYVGIDISEAMLLETQARMTIAGIDNTQLKQMSFEEGLSQVRSLPESKLITVLGLTLFNSGIQGLDVVTNHLRNQDKAFLDVQPRERIDMENLKRTYTEPATLDFHNAKLELIGLKLGESADNLTVDDNMEFSVQVTKLNPFLEERGVRVGDKIILARSYRPTLEEVINYFEKDGFRVDVFDDGGEFVGVMVEKDTFNPDTSDLEPPILAEEHPYKSHFEGQEGKEAFQRMAAGSLELMPYLQQYVADGKVLEIGPFYNPLITQDRFPDVAPTYIDRDDGVLEYVGRNGAETVKFEYGKSDPSELESLPEQDAIVTSHLLNYVNLADFLTIFKAHLKEGGYFFINEAIDYGGEEFLHEQRAKSNQEVLDTVRANGFRIVEHRIIPSPDLENQKNPRLVLVAQKIG